MAKSESGCRQLINARREAAKSIVEPDGEINATMHWIEPPLKVGDSLAVVLGDCRIEVVISEVGPHGFKTMPVKERSLPTATHNDSLASVCPRCLHAYPSGDEHKCAERPDA